MTSSLYLDKDEGTLSTDNDESTNFEISIVGRDLTEFNVTRFGSFIRRIDLSFNLLVKVRGLEGCSETLEELILDNNQLVQLDLKKNFPNLNTISLNKNRIHNLTNLLKTLNSHTPSLRYLSLLGNPACPDQLSDDHVAESEYGVYRCHLLFHLSHLRFLDHRGVTAKELVESQKLTYAKVRINPIYTPLSSFVTPSQIGSEDSPQGPDSSDPIETESRRSRGRQGKRKYRYIGKNSEGNRFIKDSDL